MEANKEIIQIIQDHGALETSLLVIMEALETGVWPKSFLTYHDEWINDVMDKIAQLAKDKYGITVPADA